MKRFACLLIAVSGVFLAANAPAPTGAALATAATSPGGTSSPSATATCPPRKNACSASGTITTTPSAVTTVCSTTSTGSPTTRTTATRSHAVAAWRAGPCGGPPRVQFARSSSARHAMGRPERDAFRRSCAAPASRRCKPSLASAAAILLSMDSECWFWNLAKQLAWAPPPGELFHFSAPLGTRACKPKKSEAPGGTGSTGGIQR